MKIISGLGIIFALMPLCIRAENVAQPVKLVSVTGDISIAAPGGGKVAPTVGAEIPVGSTITTASGGEATVSFFDGTVTVVQPNSNVSVQEHTVSSEAGNSRENTLLELRTGGVVASLDPAKKKITNFRVRTPKGVASARGTVFAVRISQDNANASVTTMSGTVTFVTDQGEFTIQFGQISNGSAVSSIADAVKANPNLANEIVAATVSVASAVGTGAIANSEQTPNLVSTVLAAIVDVAIQASPGSATEIVKNVIDAAGPALKGTGGAAALSAVRDSAIQSVTKADPAAASTAASEIDALIQQAAGDVESSTAPTENPILPPLDKTQVIVSPSHP